PAGRRSDADRPRLTRPRSLTVAPLCRAHVRSWCTPLNVYTIPALNMRPTKRRDRKGARRYCTVSFAGFPATPPTVTTTGCSPEGAPSGTVKLIWVTPLNPYGTPMNAIGASTPPTLMLAPRRGFGSRDTATLVEGVAPVASVGLRSPSPVINAS